MNRLVESSILYAEYFFENFATEEQRKEFKEFIEQVAENYQTAKLADTNLKGEWDTVFPSALPPGKTHPLDFDTISKDGKISRFTLRDCLFYARGYFELDEESAYVKSLKERYDFDKMEVGDLIKDYGQKFNFVGMKDGKLCVQDYRAMRDEQGEKILSPYPDRVFHESEMAYKPNVIKYFEKMEEWFEERNRLAELNNGAPQKSDNIDEQVRTRRVVSYFNS
jgi:hypothetical protein